MNSSRNMWGSVTYSINLLTAKMEIGGPMAALYLLGNPDHYSSHKFVPFFWKNYIREVLKSWRSDEDLQKLEPEKVVVHKTQAGEYIGFSSIHDYIYRPKIYEDKTLYEWTQMASRVKVSKKSQKHDTNIDDDELDLFPKVVNPSAPVASNAQQDLQSDVESDELNIKENNPLDNFIVDDVESESDSSEEENAVLHSFLRKHPMHRTHKVK